MPEVLSRMTVPAPLSEQEAARLADIRGHFIKTIAGDDQTAEFIITHD